jgi:hypothetical protein
MIIIFLLRKEKNKTLLVQIYIDDIIFCSTNATLIEEFLFLMHNEFEISMMGEHISVRIVF